MSEEIVSSLSVGDKVGMLTILEIIPRSRSQKRDRQVSCLCECGNQSIENYYSVKYRHTKSCGCLRLEFMKTHGLWRTSEYRTWDGMKQRCLNPNSKGYENYGGRGIKVCDRWLIFENFIADMGNKPTKFHSIDRIDNYGDYEPSNCRWATLTVQNSNKRPTGKSFVIECLICKSEFKVFKCKINEKKFCSKLCYTNFQRTKEC